MDPVSMPESGQIVLIISSVVAAIFAAAKPLMNMVRQYRSDKVEDVKDEAESKLYKHLSEQIRILAETVHALQADNDQLREQNTKLLARVAKLEVYEEQMRKLAVKLDIKDGEIRYRELKLHEMFDIIQKKEEEIVKLKDRVNILESKLSLKDEEFCEHCKLRNNQ